MNKYEMKQKAYQSALRSRALQVLVYLIDRSNKEGTCFPAIATISRELHISVSTVKRALRELTENGFVKKESRFREKNQGQTSNLYTLCIFDKNESAGKNKTENREVEKECQKSCISNTSLFSQELVYRENGSSNIIYYLIYWSRGEVELIPP